MGLYYQTEYRLGRRGGRVCRRYTGIRAVLAIAIDLLFILTFDLFFGLLFFALKIALRMLTAVLYLLSLPFLAARWVSHKVEQRYRSAGAGSSARVPLKPAWAGYDEV